MTNTSEGPLFFEGDEPAPDLDARRKGWEVAALAPPFEIDPANDAAEFEKDAEGWYETSVLVGPGGAIYTVSGTGVSDGTRTTGPGRRKVLQARPGNILAGPVVVFHHGRRHPVERLVRQLEEVREGKMGNRRSVSPAGSLSGLTPLNTNGPPWLLLDGYNDNLWRSELRAQGDKPQLTRVEITEAGKTRRVDDAIPGPATRSCSRPT